MMDICVFECLFGMGIHRNEGYSRFCSCLVFYSSLAVWGHLPGGHFPNRAYRVSGLGKSFGTARAVPKTRHPAMSG